MLDANLVLFGPTTLANVALQNLLMLRVARVLFCHAIRIAGQKLQILEGLFL